MTGNVIPKRSLKLVPVSEQQFNKTFPFGAYALCISSKVRTFSLISSKNKTNYPILVLLLYKYMYNTQPAQFYNHAEQYRRSCNPLLSVFNRFIKLFAVIHISSNCWHFTQLIDSCKSNTLPNSGAKTHQLPSENYTFIRELHIYFMS